MELVGPELFFFWKETFQDDTETSKIQAPTRWNSNAKQKKGPQSGGPFVFWNLTKTNDFFF